MSGRFLEDVQLASGKNQEYIRFMEDVWRMSGRCLEGIRRVSGSCLEDVGRVDGGCLEDVWNKNPHLIKDPMCLEGV